MRTSMTGRSAADAVGPGDVRRAEVGDRRAGGLGEPVAVAGAARDAICWSMRRTSSGGTSVAPEEMPVERSRARCPSPRPPRAAGTRGRARRRRGDRLALDQLDGLVGVPLVHQDDLAADNGERQQERLQAADVEQREREQRRRRRGRRRGGGGGVAAAFAARYSTVHQEVAEVAMRLHRTLGLTGRAGRVHDRRVVVGVDVDVGGSGGSSPARASTNVSLLGSVGRADQDDARTACSARCGSNRSSRSSSANSSTAPESRGRRPARAGPPRVERDGDGAERHGRPERRRPLGRVARRDRDAVALAHAVAPAMPRPGPAPGVRLGERDPLILVDEVRRSPCAADISQIWRSDVGSLADTFIRNAGDVVLDDLPRIPRPLVHGSDSKSHRSWKPREPQREEIDRVRVVMVPRRRWGRRPVQQLDRYQRYAQRAGRELLSRDQAEWAIGLGYKRGG